MIMTDGSKVNLNAASYIRFTSFTGDRQREVNLKGEGYFEVKPMAAAAGKKHKTPFIVHVGTLLTVTATGTIFNIKAYDTDSLIRATLLEGTLEVQRPGDSTIQKLSSGDSYILNRDGSFRVESSDPGAAVSWKEGEFKFEDRPLDEILQELCRVYDVKVDYECTPVGLFSLITSREQPIKKVLDHIEGAGNIHFTYQDRTIIVTMSHSS
jgi:ferric-dicitrate binding protein FerR (iron transport regulator)